MSFKYRTPSAAGVMAAIAIALAGCSHTAAKPADDAVRTDIPVSARMTDAAIDADQRLYEKQQGAIKALNDTGKHRVRSFSLSKAQCWLDVSFHEYTRNDRSPFPMQAMQQSSVITDFLTKNDDVTAAENPAFKTPLINGAARIREDLWKRLQTLKADPGFECAEQHAACAEVELVHAGNELNQQGWNHAKPYVQLAEDMVGEAEQALASCSHPVAQLAPKQAPLPLPVVEAPPPPPAAVATTEKISLSAGALFRFNKRSEADLLPKGRAQLDELVVRLEQVYAHVDQIRLVGHTDRLGTERYNEKLSVDRASTVQAYLERKGLNVPMTAAGNAAREPVVTCKGRKATKALTACLQPNRRVELEITGVKR